MYLFLERGEGREKERERNIDDKRETSIGYLLNTPNLGLNLQPRHVP